MILITRPLAQTANLKMLLEASDIEYAFFPTLHWMKGASSVPFFVGVIPVNQCPCNAFSALVRHSNCTGNTMLVSLANIGKYSDTTSANKAIKSEIARRCKVDRKTARKYLNE